MTSVRTEAIGARSGAVARIRFGEPSPYLPLMSEARWQLLVLESAMALAGATVGPVEGAAVPGGDFRAIFRAVALIDVVDAAVQMIETAEAWMLRVNFPDELLYLDPREDLENPAGVLTEARVRMDEAMERFQEVGERVSGDLAVSSLLTAVVSAAGTGEKSALATYAELQKEWDASLGLSGIERRSRLRRLKWLRGPWFEFQALATRWADARRAVIPLMPTVAYEPGDDLPILRIRQESPMEVVVILIGSASALVAVLNGLLDVRVKYKTRKVKEQAERSRLERELAEDDAKSEALRKLRTTFTQSEPERLKIQELAVFDTFEEAFEDDEEMKAT